MYRIKKKNKKNFGFVRFKGFRKEEMDYIYYVCVIDIYIYNLYIYYIYIYISWRICFYTYDNSDL